MPGRIPVGVSARHVHLSPEHVEVLFGPGAELTPDRPLSQPGQFACRERVLLAGPRGSLSAVRVLGPAAGPPRWRSPPPTRLRWASARRCGSRGRHEGSVSLTLIGPAGAVTIDSGVILAKRHIHMRPEDAKRFGVSDGETVWVAATEGPRRTIFGDVLVRVSPNYQLEFHIDTDEANAAGLRTGDTVVLIKA